MKIKVCGITNLHDAKLCMQNAAWAVGFNFYKSSPRYIEPDNAREIISLLPSSIIKTGIFINESYTVLAKMKDYLGLDFVQVYAPINDAPDSFKERVILSIQAATEKDLPSASVLSTYGLIMLDACNSRDGLLGGTGRLANWQLAKKLARNHKLILAGGLNAKNIQEANQTVSPYALDLASGVEFKPGIKDKSKLKELFEECNYEY
ncbi:MAG: phosphoribosylanthranilate isomerase [Legionellaceae bacterium]|nr:phosphoribosylanthranilate isomerase [Legionellaceae bacterium]